MGAQATSETNTEQVPLSSLSPSPNPKAHDYAPSPLEADQSHSITLNNSHAPDADTDTTATNSSDEFDWEAEEDAVSVRDASEAKQKARRGRKLWNLFMRLARPIRTLLVAIIGAGILIAPLLVFQFRFHSSAVRPHVHAWSLWLSITWAAGAVTYLVVDMIPRMVIFVMVMFHGQVERLKTQLEVRGFCLLYAVF